jgi:hypothetical protein
MSPPRQPFDPATDDEMMSPGDTHWPDQLPWLADWECPRCGQIGTCDEDCA